MIKVRILGFDYAFATAITGVIDLLSTAGTAWNYFAGRNMEPKFDVQLATREGRAIRCLNNIVIQAHCGFEQIGAADVILVPSIGGDVDKALDTNRDLIEVLKAYASGGTQIISNCTGAFFLAEAGILDGRKATTHWAHAERFKARYPGVQLVPEQLITTDGQVFCSGGGTAWFDMALYLIELYIDHETAIESAKAMVLDTGRHSQLSYFATHHNKYHSDETVKAVQEWIDEHYAEDFSLAWLAEQYAMSPRTLIRRFKTATGESPLAYLQTVRIEVAKKFLEVSAQTIAEITQRVGYEDVSSFSKMFKRKVGLSPREYRGRFSKATL
ncbi:GlxA family transcriptional regulator [Ketobacter sp.]|uniref:GlxA family transcriptional regulator n=1 Tax=Ketobacter sp. TaxID=2083498 RepID=UPI000F2CCC5C|nr:helix-turn-helix domain-containing protein [Ketobacter sp.]RLT94481.1 MAG: helix-turn-helix domain-containing protein [Ketobacter sp.]